MESQAVGRAYRQGQTKRVTVVRMIMKDTVEEDAYYKAHPRVTAPTLRRSTSMSNLLTRSTSKDSISFKQFLEDSGCLERSQG